jgi:cyclophilin family peptidyl-prolyl cis-trans isomerase
MKNTILEIALIAVFSAVGVAQSDPNTPPAAEKQEKPANPVVKIATNKGEIVVELEAEKAPISVANFLAYTQDGFYNGTIFHRVIKNFMIQGGGMTPDMQQKKTQPPIKNEAANGLKNKRGTMAMARTPNPDSATSQFFINHKDNAFLDYRGPSAQEIGYAVFGKVIKGMDVVDAIAVTPTKPGDVPVDPVVIESVTLVIPEKVESIN